MLGSLSLSPDRVSQVECSDAAVAGHVQPYALMPCVTCREDFASLAANKVNVWHLARVLNRMMQ